ncbi:NEAT domain-containing protein [Lentilactobacillus farraginis]|uniref:NEAT domain-containing protein n=1 Tax=Lentilactobacillus farraginis TaxID=390841 RepID=UPI000704B598|nr:NEAT domain-containing protein [Lentilactobacillus farraginis]
MHKRNFNWVKWFVWATVVLIVGFILPSSAKAQANLSDGTYTVPVTLLKANSSSTSIANMFFTQTAAVKVTGSNYQIQLQTSGANYITSMTVGGQSVNEDKSGSNATLTVNLTSPADLVPVTFGLQVPIMGTMQQSAQFQFKWANATRTQDSTTAPAANSSSSSSAATPAATSSSSSSASSSSSLSSVSSSQAPTREPNMVPSKETKTTKSTKTTKKAANTWKYVVLKSNSNAKSIANKYYTHAASVKKVNKHYRVLLKVSYKKALKLGSKAVKPISINGYKPHNVKYGSTAKTYTLTYTFNISSTSKLKKIIKGKIHVTVPYANISQTFGIRFKFSHAKAKATVKAAKATKHQTAALVTASQLKAPTASSSAKLPQTGDGNDTMTSIIGAVLGSSLLFTWGVNHEIN